MKSKTWVWFGLAAILTLPGLFVKYILPAQFQKDNALVVAGLFGVAIMGASFLLIWATEAIQRDVPQAFALSVLALIAISPEYSVDWALTFEAGSNPAYKEYAIANMIGANRMIVGFAWPLLVFLFFLKFRKAHIRLGKDHRVEIGFLLTAGLYSISIPIKGNINLFDVIFLVGLFVLYTLRILKAPVHEPHLIGPAKMLGEMPRRQRITWVLVMMAFSLATILSVAKPFALALIQTGTSLGVDQVFLIQWFAPFASEAAEILICIIFTLRGLAAEGLGTLVSSKVNQWTLLVGTLPLVYSLGSGELRPLPLSGTFVDEQGVTQSFDLIGPMLVTSAQTLLAVMIILNLRVSLTGAGLLFSLLLVQFFVPASIGQFNTNYLFAGLYFAAAVGLAIRERHHFVPTIKSMFSPRYVREQAADEAEEPHPVLPSQAVAVSTVR